MLSDNEQETIALAKRFSQTLCGGSVVLLEGDLGAGKTRFAKGIALGLGVAEEVTSPTFNLVLEYDVDSPAAAARAAHRPAQLLRHFDLYRLENPEQLDDLDYFGLIEDEKVVSLVEWGTKFPLHLPLDYLTVRITIDEDATACANPALPVEASEKRLIVVRATGAFSNEALARFAQAEGVETHD